MKEWDDNLDDAIAVASMGDELVGSFDSHRTKSLDEISAPCGAASDDNPSRLALDFTPDDVGLRISVPSLLARTGRSQH